MTHRPRIFLERLSDDYLPALRPGLAWLTQTSALPRNATIFIKPNLTFPVYRKGVMTNPACVEALVVALKDYTDRIVIGEADSGGYNKFSIDDVQEKIGLKALEKKYGVRVVNLSKLPRREIVIQSAGTRVGFPFPSALDEADVVFSVGVPKIHMNTLVSMSVKNLWGCIPETTARLKLHPHLDEVLREVVRNLKRTVAVIDGRYGLNRSGPMLGDPVDLNWLMMADNLYAADTACCRLMQIEPSQVPYLRHDSLEPEWNQDWRPFVREKFYLKRAWTDYPGLWAFRSPALSYLAYFSPLAGVLHRLLYLFRKPFYDYDNPDRTST